jgi:cation transport regulator ChaC
VDDTCWYFAYGSNLDPATFLGRRRMRPLAACPARLDGFALVFDLPVGPGERAVANLREAQGEHVHGVAYRLADTDCLHLDRTEGVHRGYYARRAVSLALPDGGTLESFTYVSRFSFPNRKPSHRYLGLLLRGARHHGLPAEYVAWLAALPLAVDERERQGELPLAGRGETHRDRG